MRTTPLYTAFSAQHNETKDFYVLRMRVLDYSPVGDTLEMLPRREL